jgi:hypothetical protein
MCQLLTFIDELPWPKIGQRRVAFISEDIIVKSGARFGNVSCCSILLIARSKMLRAREVASRTMPRSVSNAIKIASFKAAKKTSNFPTSEVKYLFDGEGEGFGPSSPPVSEQLVCLATSILGFEPFFKCRSLFINSKI